MSLLTLLTAMALALDNSMAGVFGMMWTDVLSFSHASLYFLCEQNNNKKKVKGFFGTNCLKNKKDNLERVYISN